MEDKFCNYILALIFIFLQQKSSKLCLHFRNSCWSLISFYLLLASFQQSMLTFRKSVLTFQEHMLCLISFYLLLASFQQSMLTFQELMLVSHLILPWRQAFQPHFLHILAGFHFWHFFWPNWSCFPLNVFTSTCARVSCCTTFTFQHMSSFLHFVQIGRVSHLMSSLLHEYSPADLNKSPADQHSLLFRSAGLLFRSAGLLFRSGQAVVQICRAVVQSYKPYNQGWLKLGLLKFGLLPTAAQI